MALPTLRCPSVLYRFIAIAALSSLIPGNLLGQDCHITTTVRFLNQQDQPIHLTPDNLGVEVGGIPAKVTGFSSATKPALILLIDGSGSMKGTWKQSVAVAKQFANAAGDQIAVIVFREQIVATASGRNETEKLLDQLSTLEAGRGGTALYDALVETASRIRTRNAAIVVITDGDDDASRRSSDFVITEFLRSAGPPVFGLILNDDHQQKRSGNFKNIVDATGGILSVPSSASKVAEDATSLLGEIFSPFTVTFDEPKPISTAAKLKVELVGEDKKPLRHIHVLHASSVQPCTPASAASD